jgi:hypothetical protein
MVIEELVLLISSALAANKGLAESGFCGKGTNIWPTHGK